MDRAQVLYALSGLSDLDVLALTIYGEARGEPIEGQIAVAVVVRNRVTDPRWPDDYRGVCLQKLQFSCWNDGDPTQAAVLKAAESIVQGHPDAILQQCQWIAHGVIDKLALDQVRGANHYYADSIPMPSWATNMILTARKGHHLFYRG